tara:strand:- start:1464 stop:1910 length:447 start_codon:yes stop_codon:yes gene_type:complete
MWQDILKTINITTGKTKTVDSPIVEDEDDDCERRFWNLWDKLENHMSFFRERKPYSLSTTSMTIVDTTDRDYCAIIEYLKELERFVGIGGSGHETDVGDTLNIWFIRHPYGKNEYRYSIEIYQRSPHPLFQINIYNLFEFVVAIRRFA